MPLHRGIFSLNLTKVDVFISFVRMTLFSRKLETVYKIHEKVFSPLVHVCISVSLIFAYRRPVQVFPDTFYFSPMSVTYVNESFC